MATLNSSMGSDECVNVGVHDTMPWIGIPSGVFFAVFQDPL